MERQKQSLVRMVRRLVEADRPRSNVDRNPDRPPVEVSLVAFAAQVTFIKPCKAAEVTADYVWRLSGPQMAPVNSRKKKIFGCLKVPGGWLCT